VEGRTSAALRQTEAERSTPAAKETFRLKLTDEQKKAVQKATGKDAEMLERSVEAGAADRAGQAQP
jgi:hypothetical protein